MFNIPQKFDGVSVLPAAEWNSLADELKNVITSSGQALSGADVFQISKALANYVINGNYFTDSGVANAYVLGVVGAKMSPTAYFDGFTALFKVGNTNTGISTVNVTGLGIKTIKKASGTSDLGSGDLVANMVVEIVYNLSGDYFELTRTEFIAGDFLRRNVTANVTVGYTTTAYSLGNSGTGTVTPSIANGHIQTININGNFTLATPIEAASGIIEIQATNASPGGFTINTTAYTVIENAYDSSSGKVNIIRILKIGSISYLSIQPVPIVSLTSFSSYNSAINGDFDIWQRAISFTNPSDDTYTADRWVNRKLATSAQYNILQSGDIPNVDTNISRLNYSLQAIITAADASMAAGNFVAITQRVEGFNFKALAQKPFTMSFWVKSSITGTYCVSFNSRNDDRSYVAEYTINAANTWERKVITVAASPTGGTWTYTTGVGLKVNFVLYAGSTYQTAANTWNASTSYATSNQTNFLGNNGAIFRIAAVKLEPGSNASPFVSEDYAINLERCQRYYEKSYDYNIVPGTITMIGQYVYPQQNAQLNPAMVKYTTAKANTPTIYIYNPITGAINSMRGSTNVNYTPSILYVAQRSFAINNSVTGVLQDLMFQYVIDSEL